MAQYKYGLVNYTRFATG